MAEFPRDNAVGATTRAVIEHFEARARTYDRSSRWCTDPTFMAQVIEATRPKPADRMLDLACGTGLVSKAFRPLVASIVGVDLTQLMADQAATWLDAFWLANAEELPFSTGQFDIAICRQGIQFMNASRAVAEMARVTAPGGRVVLINLCAHTKQDMREYREILQLRNPARKNFFVPGDIEILLRDAGCSQIDMHSYISEEDADAWSDNGAIDANSRDRIRALYLQASPEFKARHGVRIGANGQIVDRMLFSIAVGHLAH